MELVLREMRADEWEPWSAQQAAGYVEQLVEMGGFTLDDAQAKAAHDDASLLPDGMATPGHHFLIAAHEGEDVGWLWLGPGDAATTRWVYDVEIAAERRGRGYGRALMERAEEAVRELGGTEIMLNVFAGNAVAIALYESLGYETVEVRPSGRNMRKPVR